MAVSLNPLHLIGSSSSPQLKDRASAWMVGSQSPSSHRVFIIYFLFSSHLSASKICLNPLHLIGSSSSDNGMALQQWDDAVSIPFISSGLHHLYPVKPLSGGLLRACLHGSRVFQPPHHKFAIFLHSGKSASLCFSIS